MKNLNVRTTGNEQWLTPPEIITALGEFDLDPSSPVNRPWATAWHHYTKEDNGLIQKWFGRVWLNPPYGPEAKKWIARMAQHRNGIALVFARTDTNMFHEHIFPIADAIMFLDKRLTFYSVEGVRGKSNAGAPSVLVAYGANNVKALIKAKQTGKISGEVVFLRSLVNNN